MTRLHTAHEVDPGADAHLLALLHHLEGLIEKNLTRQRLIDHFDIPIGEGESPSRGILVHGDPTAECQLEHNASSESVRDVVVPERQVTLTN